MNPLPNFKKKTKEQGVDVKKPAYEILFKPFKPDGFRLQETHRLGGVK